MFGYSPTRRREAVAAMNGSDAWSGTRSGPAPSLELGSPRARGGGAAPARLLGEIDLASTPAAVRPARSYVRELVGQYFGADRSELGDLELLTSEVMTHSVLHSKPRRNGTVTLAALHVDRYVRVEVTDGGARVPDEPLAARALALIRELSADHGTHRGGRGTTTFWFGIQVGAGWRLP